MWKIPTTAVSMSVITVDTIIMSDVNIASNARIKQSRKLKCTEFVMKFCACSYWNETDGKCAARFHSTSSVAQCACWLIRLAAQLHVLLLTSCSFDCWNYIHPPNLAASTA